MIRYKSDGKITYFASSTEADDLVTRPTVTLQNRGRKRVCIKYHNSTTSYGLNNIKSCSEYSPKIQLSGSNLYFASLSNTKTTSNMPIYIKAQYISLADTDIAITTSTLTTSGTISRVFSKSEIMGVYSTSWFEVGQFYNNDNYIASLYYNYAEQSTKIICSSARYVNIIAVFSSVSNQYSDNSWAQSDITFSKYKFNRENYDILNGVIYSFDGFSTINNSTSVSSDITWKTTVYSEEKELTDARSFNLSYTLSTATTTNTRSTNYFSFKYTQKITYTYTKNFSRVNNNTGTLVDTTLSFRPDNFLPVMYNSSVVNGYQGSYNSQTTLKYHDTLTSISFYTSELNSYVVSYTSGIYMRNTTFTVGTFKSDTTYYSSTSSYTEITSNATPFYPYNRTSLQNLGIAGWVLTTWYRLSAYNNLTSNADTNYSLTINDSVYTYYSTSLIDSRSSQWYIGKIGTTRLGIRELNTMSFGEDDVNDKYVLCQVKYSSEFDDIDMVNRRNTKYNYTDTYLTFNVHSSYKTTTIINDITSNYTNYASSIMFSHGISSISEITYYRYTKLTLSRYLDPEDSISISASNIYQYTNLYTNIKNSYHMTLVSIIDSDNINV